MVCRAVIQRPDCSGRHAESSNSTIYDLSLPYVIRNAENPLGGSLPAYTFVIHVGLCAHTY